MNRSGRATRIIVVSLVCIVLVALGGWYAFSKPRMNVLLVTLDTTRADHLGCYGYADALTTTCDALAKDGVVFEQAYATVPLTLPSHASILTGLYPPETGIHNNGRGHLKDTFATLADSLRRQGYETGAFVGSIVLPARSGLNLGFQKYDDDMAGGERHGHEAHLMRSARLVIDSALNWLRGRKSKPFFCWIHLYDPHAPFEGHAEVFQNRFQGKEYDGDIAYADLQVGRLIKYLKDKKLYDHTMIVVVGDHGESFGEHQELEHGFLLYNATLRVPLIMTAPGQCRVGHRVPTSVSLVDIYPTILKSLNVPPPAHLSGVDLSPALQGKSIEARPCYSESEACYAAFRWAPLRSITTNSWKYINSTHEELYDLERDPNELADLAKSQPEQVEQMRLMLESVRESMVDCPESDTPFDPKHLKQLSALGYLGTTKASPDVESEESLPDVKEMIGHYNAEIDARKMLSTNPEQAVEELHRIVAAAPKFLPARLSLATGLQKLKRFDEAIEAYKQAIETLPQATDPHFDLAKLYFSRGQREKAIEQYESVLSIDPDYAMAHVNLASILMEQGDNDEARRHFKIGLEKFPESTVALFNYSVFLQRQGDLDAARRHLTRASLLDPQLPQIHYQLGLVLVQQQHFDEAATQFRETLRINPRFTGALEQLKALQERH